MFWGFKPFGCTHVNSSCPSFFLFSSLFYVLFNVSSPHTFSLILILFSFFWCKFWKGGLDFWLHPFTCWWLYASWFCLLMIFVAFYCECSRFSTTCKLFSSFPLSSFLLYCFLFFSSPYFLCFFFLILIMCKCCKDGPSFGCHLSLVTSGIHVPLIFYVLILLQEWEYLVLCV
jgi:hypothetical protein